MKPQVYSFVIAIFVFQYASTAKVPFSVFNSLKNRAGGLKNRVANQLSTIKGSVNDYLNQSTYKAILKKADENVPRERPTSLTAASLVSELASTHDQDRLLRAAEKALEMNKPQIASELLNSLFEGIENTFMEESSKISMLNRLLDDQKYSLFRYALPVARIDKEFIVDAVLSHIDKTIGSLDYASFKNLIKGMKAAYGKSIYADLEDGEDKLFVFTFAKGLTVANSPQELKVLEKMLLKVSKEFSIACKDVEQVHDLARQKKVDQKKLSSLLALIKRLGKTCAPDDLFSEMNYVTSPLHEEVKWDHRLSDRSSCRSDDTFDDTYTADSLDQEDGHSLEFGDSDEIVLDVLEELDI